MPVLRTLTSQGDAVLEWTRDKDEREVKDEFDRLVAEGHLAYRVDAPGRGTQLREFDPSAEEIVISKPLVGG